VKPTKNCRHTISDRVEKNNDRTSNDMIGKEINSMKNEPKVIQPLPELNIPQTQKFMM